VDIHEALAYLDEAWMPAPGSARAANLEARVAAKKSQPPTLERITRLMQLMGEPQRQYPAIHVTGTNGKTSATRIVSALLAAKGLSVGTFTSPHLERVHERVSWNGDAIDDDALAAALTAVANLEPILEGHAPSYFEILTAAAFWWFADVAVDVAVVEVGVGGTWDTTNVVDAAVAIVTSVGLDHVEYLGPTRASIAREKAGIVKTGTTLVLGETDPELLPIFRDTPAGDIWVRDDDFGCDRNDLAVGGRLLDLRTRAATYPDVFLPLHGAHQGDNAACALAAAEAFFDAPIEAALVTEAFGSVTSPGRLEVVRRHPLTILDGVKNPDGARAAARTLDEEFGADRGRVLVVGLLRGKDPDEMLAALDVGRARIVIACEPPTPRAWPAKEVAEAARRAGVVAEEVSQVEDAVRRGLEVATDDDVVLITGSL
jgi:dihydrofolate synthase/folylpolyglutamate synthase